MSLKLIHFPQSRSLRVLWTIYELGIDAQIDARRFDLSQLKTDDYRQLNPLGKAPVFFDGEKRLVESVAITEYIANKYADGQLTLRPDDERYGDYLQWLHFGEAGMGGYVNMLIAQTALLPEEQRSAPLKIWAEKEVANCLNFIEQHLEPEQYILGEFSLADISLIYPLFLIKVTGNGALLGEKTNAYFKQATAREAWKKACGVQGGQG